MSADWTGGPAKWAAVAVLGAASIAGMGWSVFGRVPRDRNGPPVPAATAAQPRQLVPGLPRESPAADLAPVIDLNSATQAQLELLPSIGPALARRIVEYRDAHGPFRTVDELDRVPGIGPAILAKVRPLVAAR